jgi:hypothetical protein
VAGILGEQRGDDGVLTGTGTEDENLHATMLEGGDARLRPQGDPG